MDSNENPFATAPDEVPRDAPEGSYTYALVKSAAEVPVDEVEDAGASTVEVMIRWGTTVLHVQHLTPPRSFYVGEEHDEGRGVDYFIPVEKLGVTRAPVAIVDRSGVVSVVLPPRASGTVEIVGQARVNVEQAIRQGRAEPCVELAGAHQMALPPGSRATVEVGGLVFQIGTGNAGRVVAAHFRADTPGLVHTGISFAVHLALLAAMAALTPPIGATDDDDELSAERMYTIQQYLQAAAERELEQRETELSAEHPANDDEGSRGTRAMRDEGSTGDLTTRATSHRYSVRGPQDDPDPHLARRAALLDADTFGLIGLLNGGAGGDPGAPTAPWGRDLALGNDPLSARSGLWGANIGESFAPGGLGLTGVGEGGGGRGEGIGLGALGTLGHGLGDGAGLGFGAGCACGDGTGGHGRLGGSHRAAAPRVTMSGVTASGRLPPEVIQRIVRQSSGRFRLCYENGLRSSPSLRGRVAVSFVIGQDGAVSHVGDGGSDLPDVGVIACVVRSFYGLSFPQPESGIVTVRYPIAFEPG